MLSGPRRQDCFLFPQVVLFSRLDPLVHSRATTDAKVKDRVVVSSIQNSCFCIIKSVDHVVAGDEN